MTTSLDSSVMPLNSAIEAIQSRGVEFAREFSLSADNCRITRSVSSIIPAYLPRILSYSSRSIKSSLRASYNFMRKSRYRSSSLFFWAIARFKRLIWAFSILLFPIAFSSSSVSKMISICLVIARKTACSNLPHSKLWLLQPFPLLLVEQT